MVESVLDTVAIAPSCHLTQEGLPPEVCKEWERIKIADQYMNETKRLPTHARLEEEILTRLRAKGGRTGVTLHPKYGWGGFLDLSGETALAVEKWNINKGGASNTKTTSR